MIHLVTWLPLPYQRTLCQTLARAFGSDFVAWFAERTHKDFPYQSNAPDSFVQHYLSEVGYREFLREIWSDSEAVIILCGWSSRMTNRTLLLTTLLRKPVLIWADHPHPRDRSTLKKLARKAFLNLLARRVQGFLACGRPTVEHLVSLGIEQSKITNFPYWVDLPNEWSIPERHADEDASKRPLRLIAIGRQVPVKQFDVAIRAVALANKNAGKTVAELIFVGDGPERTQLEALAQTVASTTKVSFTGWLEIEETLERLRQADVLVLPSKFDGFGVVVLEAMAAGRPVLASEGVVAARDRDEGTGAVFFHPIGDFECLANQIVSLASDRDLLNRGGLAARATAEKWPPSRAVAIIGKILDQTTPGGILRKRTHGEDDEFVIARQEINQAEGVSIAAGGK